MADYLIDLVGMYKLKGSRILVHGQTDDRQISSSQSPLSYPPCRAFVLHITEAFQFGCCAFMQRGSQPNYIAFATETIVASLSIYLIPW